MQQLTILIICITFIISAPTKLFGQDDFVDTFDELDSLFICNGLTIDTIKIKSQLKYIDCIVNTYIPSFNDGLDKIYYARIKTKKNIYADYRTYILVYNDSIKPSVNYNLLIMLFKKRKFTDPTACFKGVRYYTYKNFLILSICSSTYIPIIESSVNKKIIYYLNY